VGSAVSGALALIALALVARHRGPGEYATFAVLWGCFFGIGGCLAGYQQELTRSLVDHVDDSRTGVARRPLAMNSLILAAPLAALAGGLAFAVTEAAGRAWWTGLVIALGVLSLSLLVQVNGVSAAHDHWGVVTGVVTTDAVLRSVAIGLVVVLADGWGLTVAIVIGALAWLPLALVLSVRQALLAETPVRLGAIAPRAYAAMVSAGCAALMIAGFPFLFGLLRTGDLGRDDGVLLAALTLIRSPILLVAYAYRPVVLKILLDSSDWARTFLRLWSWCSLVGGGLILLASAAGPWGIHLVAGGAYGISRSDTALMAAGAALLMMLIVSGVTLVVLGAHARSTQGWLVALAATCAALVLSPTARLDVLGAGLVGPVAGLAWHGVTLARMIRGRASALVEP
jgi:hypothetical protein